MRQFVVVVVFSPPYAQLCIYQDDSVIWLLTTNLQRHKKKGPLKKNVYCFISKIDTTGSAQQIFFLRISDAILPFTTVLFLLQ